MELNKEWAYPLSNKFVLTRLKYCFKNSIAGEVIDKSWWNQGEELLYTCQETPIFSNFNKFPKRKRTKSGNLLLTRNATPYIFIPEENSIYSNVVQKIEVLPQNDLRFIKYSLECAVDSQRVNGDTIPSWNMDVWSNLYLPLFDKNKQIQIVDFLDDKCKRIDDIINTINDEIKCLNDYKYSYITEILTTNNDEKAVIVDNKIIKEIPSSWKVGRIKNVAKLLNGDRGSNYPSVNEIKQDGVPFITADDIHNYYIDSQLKKFITEQKYNKLGGVKLKTNDIIFCLRGSGAGNCSLNDKYNEGTVASSLVVIRPRHINVEFLNYLLQSNIVKFQNNLYYNGSCALNLSAENVSSYYIPIPDINKQKEMVNFLNKKLKDIDELMSLKQKKIDELKKYKKSLIYEYVTGKKEVE